MTEINSADTTNAPLRVSWDTIIFVLFWTAQFWSSELSGALIPTEESTILSAYLTASMYYAPMSTLLLFFLAAYVVADLMIKGRWQFVVKLTVLLLTIIAFVITPTLASIIHRHSSEPYLFIHDGAIQTEEAIKFLIAGKNPYAEDYASTPMGQWKFHEPGVEENPAMYHLPYMPLTFLGSLPFYVIGQMILGWYDQRFVYLALLLVCTLLIIQVGQSRSAGLAGLTILALNPLFVPFFIEGRNDILVTFWFLGAIIFLQREHYTLFCPERIERKQGRI